MFTRFSYYFFLFGLTIIPFDKGFADDICLTWFQESKILPQSKGCILECDILPKDMSTFACAEQCDQFCKAKKCTPDPYWRDKIKNGRPPKWPLPTEILTDWKLEEKTKLLELLSRLPDELKTISFHGFYRMKKSIDHSNPGTTGDDGKSIVIYDRAFNHPNLSTSRIAIHEFGHIIYLHFSKTEQQDYRDTLKWRKSPSGSFSRPGDFISSQVKDDPDEDFAENINFYLFEPEQLRAMVPLAYKWISKKFSKDFKMKKECPDVKK